MKRWVAFGILAGSVFVLSGSCQGPDAFYGPIAPGSGGTGVGGSGFGGFTGAGIGGRGLGGFIGVGGQGNGGAIGAGGRGTGGTTGVAGATGTGGMTGVDGGGVGTGGRIVVDAGPGCISTLINNGYAAGTATPCSMCRENTMSLTDKCTQMIDCLAPSCTGGTCYINCLHSVSGSGPLDGCVMALVAAACGS